MPRDAIKQVKEIKRKSQQQTNTITSWIAFIYMFSPLIIIAVTLVIFKSEVFSAVSMMGFAVVTISVALYLFTLTNKPKFLILNIGQDSNDETKNYSLSSRLRQNLTPLVGFSILMPLFYGAEIVAISELPQSLIKMTGFGGIFASIVASLMLIILFLRLLDEQKNIDVFPPAPYVKDIIDSGVGLIPKKVRVGSSSNLLLDFELSKGSVANVTEDASIDIHRKYLEVELQAAGLKVDGEKRVRFFVGSPLPSTVWNLCFPKEGTHTINFMISLVKPSNNPSDNIRDIIFRHEHDIKVINRFTASWQPILVVILMLLSFTNGIVTLISTIPKLLP